MRRPRVVIVGAGFAGYRAARVLGRPARGRAAITVPNPTDYFLHLPLLPRVAAGIPEARRVTVSLAGTLRGVRLVLGEARIDFDARVVHCTGPEGETGTLDHDRLVLAAGSVNKLLPIPALGLPLERGRLLVEPTLRVPGRPEAFACGDAAAVPDPPCQSVQLGLVRSWSVHLDTASPELARTPRLAPAAHRRTR